MTYKSLLLQLNNFNNSNNLKNEQLTSFQIEFYYFLPYIKKNIDLNNNVFNTVSNSIEEQQNQIADDFSIENREGSCSSSSSSSPLSAVPCSMTSFNLSNFLSNNINHIKEMFRGLIKQLEIDLLYNSQLNHHSDELNKNQEDSFCDSNIYLNMSDFGCKKIDKLDGKIIRTDMTTIHVSKLSVCLLQTPPPGTSVSPSNSTCVHRINQDRKVNI